MRAAFFLILSVIAGFAYIYLLKFIVPLDKISWKKIKNSPNFQNGIFQNKHPIPPIVSGRSTFKAWIDFLFKKYPKTTPRKKLVAVKTNLKSLNKNEDILIWFGHSSYFLQLHGMRFLIDPIFNNCASPLPFFIKAFSGSNIYAPDDFPEIDYLIITHDHWDHLDYSTLNKLKPKVKNILTTLGVGSYLRKWGFDSSIISEMDWGETLDIQGGKVTCLPSRHFSGRFLKRNGTLWGSFLIDLDGFRVFIDGDSGYDDHYKFIGEKFGSIDLALMEAGQYSKDWKFIHKNPEEILKSLKDLQAKRFIAGHNSKFRLSKHPWSEPLEKIYNLSKGGEFKHLTPMIGEIIRLNDNSQKFDLWWRDNT